MLLLLLGGLSVPQKQLSETSFLSAVSPQRPQQPCTTATTCFPMAPTAWPRPLPGWTPPPFTMAWPLGPPLLLHLAASAPARLLLPRLLRPALWLPELLTPPTSAPAPPPPDQKAGEEKRHQEVPRRGGGALGEPSARCSAAKSFSSTLVSDPKPKVRFLLHWPPSSRRRPTSRQSSTSWPSTWPGTA